LAVALAPVNAYKVAIDPTDTYYIVSITVVNTGTVPADSITLATAKLGGVSGTLIPPSTVTSVPVGATATFMAQFPISQVPGLAASLSFTGTAAGGGLAAKWGTSVRSVKLP